LNFSWFSAWERKDLNLEVQLSDDEMLEKVWPDLAYGIGYVRQVCYLGIIYLKMPHWTDRTEGFPAILRTIVQTFFIEVRLLILETNDCHDWRLVDFTVRLAMARMIRRFSMLAEVGHLFTF